MWIFIYLTWPFSESKLRIASLIKLRVQRWKMRHAVWTRPGLNVQFTNGLFSSVFVRLFSHYNAKRHRSLRIELLLWIKRANKNQTRKTVRNHISKGLEESLKYDAQRSIFDELRGVWKCDQTLSLVLDVSSRSKLNLTRRQRNKIENMPANEDRSHG